MTDTKPIPTSEDRERARKLTHEWQKEISMLSEKGPIGDLETLICKALAEVREEAKRDDVGVSEQAVEQYAANQKRSWLDEFKRNPLPWTNCENDIAEWLRCEIIATYNWVSKSKLRAAPVVLGPTDDEIREYLVKNKCNSWQDTWTAVAHFFRSNLRIQSEPTIVQLPKRRPENSVFGFNDCLDKVREVNPHVTFEELK